MKQMANPVQGHFYDEDTPAIVRAFASGTKGYFSVIVDEPGPNVNHYLVSREQLKSKFNIDPKDLK